MEQIKVNCLIGDTVYKICPKCNDRHNGTCKNCAWGGCIWNYCTIDPYVWFDGSCNEYPKQVVTIKVNENNFIHINEQWNIGYFATKEDCEKAIAEYEAICAISDRKERKAEFDKWYNSRKTDCCFLRI